MSKPDQPRGDDGRFGSKLTADLGASIVASLESGLFDAQIALKHGLDVTTLKSWIDRGIDEEATEPYKSFAERYIKAAIALEEKLIAKILLAAEPWQAESQSTEVERTTKEGFDDENDDDGPSDYTRRKTKHGKETRHGDWKASAWILERRWPLRWGITRQPEGGPKEAIRLPEASQSRARRVREMTHQPPPELVKAFREAGYDIVRRKPEGEP